MALISCPECGHRVSDVANNCPSCGYPISEFHKNKPHADHHEENISKTMNNEIVDFTVAPKKKSGSGPVLLIVALMFIGTWLTTDSCSDDKEEDITIEAQEIKNRKEAVRLAKLDSINQVIEANEEIEFLKTKAGKIYIKHPEWSKEDCVKLSEGEIWIGMHYDMLVFLRGKPNNINASNYGRGNNYQACWNRFKPRCFYYDDRYIITAYN